jgi:hypothetical protein
VLTTPLAANGAVITIDELEEGGHTNIDILPFLRPLPTSLDD